MKALFLFIFIFINTHVMSNMDKDIDFDIIESYKKPITIPAKYLEVFSIVYKGFSSNCRSGGSGFCQGCKKRVASPISRYTCLGTRHILTRFSIKGSTLIIHLRQN
jgi:Na+-transporting NADH:ubiquinone oxidoreductase subunit NqrF